MRFTRSLAVCLDADRQILANKKKRIYKDGALIPNNLGEITERELEIRFVVLDTHQDRAQ